MIWKDVKAKWPLTHSNSEPGRGKAASGKLSRVQFIDGPFDGHWQSYHSSTKRLPCDVVWFVSDDALLQIHGDATRRTYPAKNGKLTSIVLYSLDRSAPLPVYRYVGAISQEHFKSSVRGLTRKPPSD